MDVISPKTFSVIIAEDDINQRQLLVNFIQEMSDLVVLDAVSSGDRLVEACVLLQPDIVLLDIGLHKKDGITAARELFSLGLKPQIIVITGSLNGPDADPAKNIDYLLTGYELKFVDFLLKPVSENKLLKALHEAKIRIHSSLLSSAILSSKQDTHIHWITCKLKFRERQIPEDLIMYVEKAEKYLANIYLSDGEVVQTTSTLSEIHNQSQGNIFRSHKSFLVNIKHVKTVFASIDVAGGYDINLKHSSSTIPLSRKLYPNYDAAKESTKE
ncbi:LytR/AlgR family response regulator transcription factor [Paenibacillus sp. NPDC056579]|uniref:LytR/AlgR family response regulator transcription factor n=1 Tax=Paenibacillus sp. NPDC056579 TaxID=3345871 RepID=UPI00368899CA